jgi:hypothetical protein
MQGWATTSVYSVGTRHFLVTIVATVLDPQEDLAFPLWRVRIGRFLPEGHCAGKVVGIVPSYSGKICWAYFINIRVLPAKGVYLCPTGTCPDNPHQVTIFIV